MDEREILSRIIPYVPPYWVRQALADPTRPLVGREERTFAAVLFADISGFTPITEALSQYGHEGIEELSALLDRYFTVMSQTVFALGGEVVKFAGDALIAAFSVCPERGDAHLGSAIACALRMQGAMATFSNVHTSVGDFPLRIKIGISEGNIYNTTVGDEGGEMQPVFAGLPLARCQQAEKHAAAGEIVVDAGVARRAPGHLDIGEARATFCPIFGGNNLPTLPAAQPFDLSSLSEDQIVRLIQRLKPYLPMQLVQRIRQGQTGVYGEHRQVTVMFVKFGGLNYDWEPQVGEALQIYFSAMQACVARYGGRLNEIDIGPGGGTLVIFFGAPTAHEDDELRAVSCAWEMQQAVSQVRMQAAAAAKNLRQCIGISSGALFVGDVGGPLRRVYAAVGDEVNLAARLMSRAEWGEVVVTRLIQKRSAIRFEFESMGEIKLKGKAEPVPVFALLAPKMGIADEQGVAQWTHPTPLLGRDEQLQTIHAVQERAWQGIPQLLLISGEAGIGKSRLLAEALHSWRTRGGMTWVGDCRVQGGHADYAPWIRILRAAFGIQEEDSAERQQEKIESQLVLLSPELARQADLFASFLGLRTAESFFLHPHRYAQRHHAVIELIHALAQRRPLLLTLENVQDIDHASLNLLNDLLRGVNALSLLVCAIYRPVPDLIVQSESIPTTIIQLGPLNQNDLQALADQWLQEAGQDVALAASIAARAQGNPLYARQLVKAIADSGDAGRVLEQMNVPEGAIELIQSQIDRLNEDLKLTLRVAAVIGTAFTLDVLQRAHPSSPSPAILSNELAVLERMQLIRPLSSPDTTSTCCYAFTQEMVRQVVYDRLLRSDRERFHRAVAEALEALGQAEHSPRVLAEHFEQARVFFQAARYWHQAGRKAAQAGETEKALASYNCALTALDACAREHQQTVEARQFHLVLLVDRAQIRQTLPDGAGALEDFEQALRLATGLGQLDVQGQALFHIGQIAFDQARHADALYYTRQALQRFSATGDRVGLARSLALTARVRLEQGHLPEAEQDILQAIRLAPTDELANELEIVHGQIQHRSGNLDQATDLLQIVLKNQQLATLTPTMRVAVLGQLALIMLERGRWGQAIRLAEEAVQAGRVGNALDLADAQCVLGQVLVRVGDLATAVDCLSAAIATFGQTRMQVRLQNGLPTLGEALLAQGQYEAAEERLSEALAMARQSQAISALVHAQLGISKLAAIEHNWAEEQRLCSEARAWARRAGLQQLIVEARLGLARAYLGRQTWKAAQYEAMLARDKSHQLRCPYNLFRAEAMLGEALIGLEMPQQAEEHFQQARSMLQRLIDTLPQPYQDAFAKRPYVQKILNAEARV